MEFFDRSASFLEISSCPHINAFESRYRTDVPVLFSVLSVGAPSSSDRRTTSRRIFPTKQKQDWVFEITTIIATISTTIIEEEHVSLRTVRGLLIIDQPLTVCSHTAYKGTCGAAASAARIDKTIGALHPVLPLRQETHFLLQMCIPPTNTNTHTQSLNSITNISTPDRHVDRLSLLALDECKSILGRTEQRHSTTSCSIF